MCGRVPKITEMIPILLQTQTMNQHSLYLHGISIHVGTSDIPDCKELGIAATLQSADGQTMHRTRTETVYGSLLNDKDQLPWLIAHVIRSMMTERDLTSPRLIEYRRL